MHSARKRQNSRNAMMMVLVGWRQNTRNAPSRFRSFPDRLFLHAFYSVWVEHWVLASTGLRLHTPRPTTVLGGEGGGGLAAPPSPIGGPVLEAPPDGQRSSPSVGLTARHHTLLSSLLGSPGSSVSASPSPHVASVLGLGHALRASLGDDSRGVPCPQLMTPRASFASAPTSTPESIGSCWACGVTRQNPQGFGINGCCLNGCRGSSSGSSSSSSSSGPTVDTTRAAVAVAAVVDVQPA